MAEQLMVIARIRNDFPEKFGLPRQSGLGSAIRGRIVFEKPYDTPDALRGIGQFSHLWLIWGFSGVPERGAFEPQKFQRADRDVCVRRRARLRALAQFDEPGAKSAIEFQDRIEGRLR